MSLLDRGAEWLAKHPRLLPVPVGRLDRWAIYDGHFALCGFIFHCSAVWTLQIAQRNFPNDELLQGCQIRRIARCAASAPPQED